MRNLLHILVAILLISTPSLARAEEMIVCIAVYPCDDDGRLLPEYSDEESPCYTHFLEQCAEAAADKAEYLSKALDKAKARIRALRR